MLPKRLTAGLVIITAISGCCAGTTGRTVVTVVNEGFPHRSRSDPILIDASLAPEVNVTRRAGFFEERVQNVVIRATGPLKLVPAGSESMSKLAEKTRTTLTIEGQPTRPYPLPIRPYPVLLDPAIIAKVNKIDDATFWSKYQCDQTQRIVLENCVPLMLVPASAEDIERLRRAKPSSVGPPPLDAAALTEDTSGR